jgi:RNA polymerase sigma-70 factor (ECF subfamily)
VRALAKWPLFRRNDNLRAWLFTIMHNIHVNAAKRQARTAMPSLDAGTLPDPASPAAQGHAIALSRLAEALDNLPDDQRRTVLLVGLEGFSYAEAAEITGVPLGTVMSRLSRGRDRLRELTEGGEASGSAAHLKRIK